MTDVAELLDTLVPRYEGTRRLEPRPPRRQARAPSSLGGRTGSPPSPRSWP